VLHSDRLLNSLVKIFIGEVCGLLRKKNYSTFQKSKSVEHKRRRGTAAVEGILRPPFIAIQNVAP